MTDQEVRLRCLEIAIEQARREGKSICDESVAIVTTWLYNHTKAEAADKAPDIFTKTKVPK